MPPETAIVSPVIKEEEDEQRNDITDATSPGTPNLKFLKIFIKYS